MAKRSDPGPRDEKSSLSSLERTFLDLALERGLVTAAVRGEVEEACTRARAEGETLRPWRAAVVRGHLARVQADRLLAEITARADAEHGLDSSDVADEESARPTAAPPVDKEQDERLGALALELGFVTEPELKLVKKSQRALRREKKPHGIGALLAQEGFAPEPIVEALVRLGARRSARGPEDALAQALVADLKFAKIALELELATAEHIERATAEQRRRVEAGDGSRALTDGLAFVLVEQKAMTGEARSLVLDLVDRPAAAPAAPAPAASGTDDEVCSFLTENNLVTATRIKQARELQRELRGRGIDRRVGDLLVLQGAIDRPTLETLDRAQDSRKKAPAKRRRAFQEELAAPVEHPLTVLAGLALALVLVSIYVLATGGFSLPRSEASGGRAPSAPPSTRERGRSG